MKRKCRGAREESKAFILIDSTAHNPYPASLQHYPPMTQPQATQPPVYTCTVLSVYCLGFGDFHQLLSVTIYSFLIKSIWIVNP